MLFSNLGLIKPIEDAVRRAGYTTPTPIQAAAIPPALAGRDVLGCAQTGTGKTAAFSLPILQRIDELATGDDPVVRALILTPTRELAAQIGESIATYGHGLELWHTVIFGGVNEKPQIAELERGVDILVATPGRLLDLAQRRFVDLSHVQVFVLDEADRMLDMGFIHDVRKVVAMLPQKKQTLFFSATMPHEIRELADRLLKDPAVVSVTPVSSTVERIGQSVYFVDRGEKARLLVDLLKREPYDRVLVFSRTKHGANKIVQILDKAGIEAAAIHGNKSQGARTRALDGFKSGELGVLVATDIAARGIDVDGVSHVINFDIPNIPETYVHRIGRTARAGRDGLAISLCEYDERAYLEDVEKLIQLNVPRVESHEYPPTEPVPPLTDLTGKVRHSKPPKGGPGGERSGRGGGHGRGGHQRPRVASAHGGGHTGGGRSSSGQRSAGGQRPSGGGGARPGSSARDGGRGPARGR